MITYSNDDIVLKDGQYFKLILIQTMPYGPELFILNPFDKDLGFQDSYTLKSNSSIQDQSDLNLDGFKIVHPNVLCKKELTDEGVKLAKLLGDLVHNKSSI